MSGLLRTRLAAMMFLEYFVWGSWYVTFGTFLGLSLHFDGVQIGWAAGTTAIGAILAPFFVGLIADRFFAAQKTLAVLHLLGAGLLWLAAGMHSFAAVYVSILLYSLCYMPTLALTSSLALRQLQDPGGQFATIRVFGSLGWIVAGLMIGPLGLEATAAPLRIAAGCSLLLGVYCLTLPDTPPLEEAVSHDHLIPRRALALLGERSTAVFALASLLLCVPLQFYYAFTNLFLNEAGVTGAAAKMSGGQMSELVCMVLIPLFFRRLGVKAMLAAGMLAWVARYLAFAWGDVSGRMWLLWAGILLHGICYDFFFVVGQIHIDRKAPRGLRAATQGLITFLTYGVGMFLGSWLSGRVVEAYTRAAGTGTAHDWHAIWLFAAACAGAVLVLFLLVFKDEERRSDSRPAALPVAGSAQEGGA